MVQDVVVEPVQDLMVGGVMVGGVELLHNTPVIELYLVDEVQPVGRVDVVIVHRLPVLVL